MGIIFDCSVRFLNTILPYIFLITNFWKKGNGNGIKTFEFNLWKAQTIKISSCSQRYKELFS